MKPEPKAAPQEVLAGLVERVTFHNEENGFCVLRTKARGHRDLVTVVGQAASISAGEWITASGEWINDRTHGQQFRARFLKTSAPTSIEGIEKYLGSGMIRGIGPVYAKKLVRAFGEKVFDTIETEPGRLQEVDGIGPVRGKRITNSWAEQKVIREIMMFLHSNGVGTARAVRIYKTYGSDAVQVMTENPYRLTRDVRGIGFKTADAIAMRLGVEKTAMIRLRAGVSFALPRRWTRGTADCRPGADTARRGLLEAPADLIRTALDLELSEGAVIADKVGETDCVFLAGLYRAEQTIADRLIRIASGALPWPSIDAAKAVAWVEERGGLTLADSQRDAIRLALTSKALVITGGPGVGKTTIVKSILRILGVKGVQDAALRPDRPRGQAHDRSDGIRGQDDSSAARSRSQGRRLQAQRGQRPRLRPPGRRRGLDGRRPAHAGVVEGGSGQRGAARRGRHRPAAVGRPWAGARGHHRVGGHSGGAPHRSLPAGGGEPDHHQRPSDQPGQLMPDLAPPAGDSDFYFVPADDPETAVSRILELVKTRIPKRFGLDPIRDVQVLCPMNRGGVGARSLNIELQAVLNPAGERKVERFGWTFAPGDKVMQIENDYDKEVYNGDIGYIGDVDPEAGEVTVSFDGRAVVYGFGELDVLVPAYAATIHKSQGSEYPAVIIPVLTQHYPMLQRNLLYTGVTRGKRLVVLVGQKKAVAIAVRNASSRRRWSKLGEWLRRG